MRFRIAGEGSPLPAGGFEWRVFDLSPLGDDSPCALNAHGDTLEHARARAEVCARALNSEEGQTQLPLGRVIK